MVESVAGVKQRARGSWVVVAVSESRRSSLSSLLLPVVSVCALCPNAIFGFLQANGDVAFLTTSIQTTVDVLLAIVALFSIVLPAVKSLLGVFCCCCVRRRRAPRTSTAGASDKYVGQSITDVYLRASRVSSCAWRQAPYCQAAIACPRRAATCVATAACVCARAPKAACCPFVCVSDDAFVAAVAQG